MKSSIHGFKGEYAFLSNMTPCRVLYDGASYNSVEHAYQAAKTLDPAKRLEIHACVSPYDAKKLGRKLLRIRPDWEDVKESVMYTLLTQKFSQEPYKVLLDGTKGRYIEETNNWRDTYWGVCNGVGSNVLGKLIMGIRDGK